MPSQWAGAPAPQPVGQLPGQAGGDLLPSSGAGAARFSTPVVGSIMAPTRPVPVNVLAAPLVRSRWRKTPTTFGPLGRVLATFALVVPFIFFLIIGILTGGFELGGAVIWGVILMPWGLRDVWKAGTVEAH